MSINEMDYYDIVGIKNVLKHEYPMLLIDRVIHNEPGTRTQAIKLFSINEMYFQGHYPGVPIVPGTILLEALSQTAAFTIISGIADHNFNVLFTGARQLRFYKQVHPGDCVRFDTTVIKEYHGLWTVNGEGILLNADESDVCIRAEMTFVKM